MIKESILRGLSQEDRDLLNRWKHDAVLYNNLKEEKSFFLKIELPGYKISEVVNGDIEDVITGSTLEAFNKLVKNLKTEVDSLESAHEKQELLIQHFEVETQKLGVELVEVKSELKELKARNFWQRLLNK